MAITHIVLYHKGNLSLFIREFVTIGDKCHNINGGKKPKETKQEDIASLQDIAIFA